MIHVATLAETLGKPLTANEVKALLGIGINHVYANAQEIGGVRIGKKWVFFESNVLAALRRDNADQSNKHEDGKNRVVREGDVPREGLHEKSPHEARCGQVGANHKERTGKPAVNRHGLFVHAV